MPSTNAWFGGGGSKGSRCKSGAVPATVNADGSRPGKVRNLPWSVVRFPGRDQPRERGAGCRAAHPSVTTVVNRRILCPHYPSNTDQIVITASRAPESEAESPASVTIIDSSEIERLDEPLVADLLRLTPSAAVTDIRSGGVADGGSDPRRRSESYPAVRRRDQDQRPRFGRYSALRTAERRPRLSDRDRAWAAIGPVGIGCDRRSDRGQRSG